MNVLFETLLWLSKLLSVYKMLDTKVVTLALGLSWHLIKYDI